jgi:dynein heavy chain
LFYTFPIIHVSASSTVAPTGPGLGKGKQDQASQDKSAYSCPVYKYPKRNDKYLIFRVPLKCEGQGQQSNLSRGVTPAMNWKLKGVALLCTKE